MTNPYETKSVIEDRYEVEVIRTSATYLVALMIGVGVAMIGPVYLLMVLLTDTQATLPSGVQLVLEEFTLPVVVGIGVALVLAMMVPQRVCVRLTPYRLLLPFLLITVLFSTMFSMLGYGYLNHSIQLGSFRLSSLALFHAVIVGIAVLLHIVCRPTKKLRSDSLGREQ
ncbi:MAG: hypothetical protein ACF8AM_02970 [Rhodopirellula sp. JB055]|uniref:hypothetical protein n=1 Tax=Rhodopirellula sp. JB055 TaxID=3342846 RepID=UPI00370B15A3